jgi:hypothetical protein
MNAANVGQLTEWPLDGWISDIPLNALSHGYLSEKSHLCRTPYRNAANPTAPMM